MARSEQQFIRLCKKQIERKFSFGNGNGYTQRDLEVLADHIKEKTGVVISLSTLKRLWKDNYKQSPQLATLNALAVVLGCKDWQEFKLTNHPGRDSALKWGLFAAASVIVVFIVIWVSGFSFLSEPLNTEQKEEFSKPVRITGPILFEASKTVTSGIPNTVIFKYDVSNVEADTIFIQQSWNRHHRVGLDPKGNVATSIYYESGFHRARLMANDSVLARQPVHIISDGWEPHIYYSDDQLPIDFKSEKFITNGKLHLDSSMLARHNIDFSKRFYSRTTISQVFNVDSENFTFSTRMKVDSLFDQLCSWMDVIVVTEVHIFSVGLTEKGCEKNAGYKLGEISKNGENNDLSAFGCDVYDWQELEVNVDRKSVV